MTMSFEAAIGRVDQILQFQQQIQDPGSAASSAASGGAGLSSGSGTAASSSNFAAALAGAQAASDTAALNGLDSTDTSGDELTSGTDPLAGLTSLNSLALSGITPSATATGLAGAGGVTGGEATSAADPSVQAMTDEANSLIGKPYVWGGGHSGWGPQSGYDCSGFVSAVLHAGGYLSSPQDTETLPSQPGIESGPGQYVTIYDRTTPGTQGHTIIDINGQFYESGGEAGAWGGGGGVEAISTPSAAYLSTFNLILHPEGL
jgi:cell wall-associated NlpC family hydrolase